MEIDDMFDDDEDLAQFTQPRAIESEVRAEAQEPVANIALRIAAKYATGGEGVRLAKDICEALKGSASQPPAPCPVCANLRETNRELSSKYDALQARGDEQSGLIDRLKQEAQVHAQEARTANSTIAEIYQAISGATGEPGNWHGAAPVREYIAQQAKIVAQQAERIAEIEAKPAARYLNTNAHLESVIAEQAALIEKCEKALNVVTVMPKSHESVRLAVQSLAAIATHRSQS